MDMKGGRISQSRGSFGKVLHDRIEKEERRAGDAPRMNKGIRRAETDGAEDSP